MGKWCFFAVTWEAFLLLAGLLGFVFCSQQINLAKSAVRNLWCSALQLCAKQFSSANGSIRASVESLCWSQCITAGMEMLGWWAQHPDLSVLAGGGVMSCFVIQEGCRAANWASREENASLVRKLLPFCSKVILILFWSTACCFLSPWWLVASVLNTWQAPSEIYEEWGGNKSIVCFLDLVSLPLGMFSLVTAASAPEIVHLLVAKCSVLWEAVLLCACLWHCCTCGCSACHLLTLWVQFHGGQHFFELPVLQLRSVLSSLSGKCQRLFKTGLAGGGFFPVASKVTDKSTEMVT